MSVNIPISETAAIRLVASSYPMIMASWYSDSESTTIIVTVATVVRLRDDSDTISS